MIKKEIMGLEEVDSDFSIANCYEYSATICDQNYTNAFYLVAQPENSYFVLYPPLGWEDNVCLSTINWPLYLEFSFFTELVTGWVLYNSKFNPLMYIVSSNEDELPTEPFSSWTIVEGSEGELFTDFSVQEVNCPSIECDCSIILTGTNPKSPGITANGYNVGVFNGKFLYLIDVGPPTGQLNIYWNNVTNRWEVNYAGLQYEFPIGEPMGYLESEGECPEGFWVNGFVTPEGVYNIATFLTDCGGVNDDYINPPIEDYCCSNISFTNGVDTVQFEMIISELIWASPNFPYPGTYSTYTFNNENSSYAIRFNGINQTWELWLLDPDEIFLGFSLPNSVPDLCPESIFSNWFLTAAGQDEINNILENSYALTESPLQDYIPMDSSFFIYKCQSNYDIPNEPDIAINCDEFFSCKFVNLLKKQKALLSEDVVSNSNNEVFGLKGCEENWNNIYMKYLIIDALKCSPYGYYSEATENCLINKLTENCNC
jgi:hypothetical protein